VDQHVGLDQGCPLSPALYSIAVRDVLDTVQETMRQIDPSASVTAYLDDTYLTGTPEAVRYGMHSFAALTARLGLKVHPNKTKVWAPHHAAESLPDELRQFRTETLVAVGTAVPFARATARPDNTEVDDRTDVPLDLDLLEMELEPFRQRQR